MLFKSFAPHLHVKLRIWSQVTCILIRGTAFTGVRADMHLNGTRITHTEVELDTEERTFAKAGLFWRIETPKKKACLIFISIIFLFSLCCTFPANWFVGKNLKIKHNSGVWASRASCFLRLSVTYQLRPALYRKVCFYSSIRSRGKEGQNRLLQAKLNLCRAASCHKIKPLTLSAVFIIRWPFLCVLCCDFDVLGHNREPPISGGAANKITDRRNYVSWHPVMVWV